jgi:agmatine deiminase
MTNSQIKTEPKSHVPSIVPAEWSAHESIWVGFPSDADLWLENLEGAQIEVANMVKALSGGDQINLLVSDETARNVAANLLMGVANVTIHLVPFGDIWIRDTGCIFTSDGQALRFLNNGWGGKYDLPHDDTVGDRMAELSGAPVVNFDFILEGGAIDQDGMGTLLTTRQCVLNPNRNPDWNEDIATQKLCEAFGASKIIWLDQGMLNDHTDGHVDNIARFVGENKVVCQSAFGDDDPNKEIFETIANTLRASKNAKGESLEVIQILSPGKFLNEDGDIIPASHMNFLIGNKVVVVPTYGSESSSKAVEILQTIFPNHQVIGLASNFILSGGGSFHCITQQEPIAS